ncbi:helix-turn-helix domain-containing protein [Chengkuizengella sediminis]|uniref:helix-turn-helix domain-containing protein n=1 Tax=Chengkuizengella sediminis TaxID=1885917 RepID=UPI00138A60AF|nr:helix-turn-helix domain-containing protein [Chengkuizengella sediminis]NDI33964.1 helix-turn-helix domain-containing protein [Chengkuizengella sediminis]
MDKKILYAIVYLGICMMISAWLISNAMHTNNQPEKQLLTKIELGKYLGLEKEALDKIVPEINPNEVHTLLDIPSIRINNLYYFPKKAIDEWLLTGERSFYENYDFDDFFDPMSNK